ncbi:MAG: hypothetical protein ACPG32_09375 [Akkermansiaceae bacterium]
MSKVFGTIAAVLLAAAAFVAFKNKEAYAKEIQTHQGQVRKKDSNQKSLAKELERFNVADGERKRLLADAEGVQKEVDTQTATYNKLEKDVKALEEQHDSNAKEIASADDILKGLPDPKELVPKVRRMKAQLAEARTGIATQEARLANLTREDKSGKASIKGLRDRIELYNTGKSFPNLRTRISTVYRNWGFVILAAGDKQGVVSGSTLNVVRGGEVIAKLKVTAVEAGRASANIVLDSVAEGTTVHSGDTVVTPKEEAKPAAAAPAVKK